MSCGPCKDGPECKEISEDDEEYETLTRLYKRLFEEHGGGATDCGESGERRRPPPPPPSSRNNNARAAAADYCGDATAVNESPVRRADRQLTALLRKEDGVAAVAEGDVKHLTARLPEFRSCRSRKPGTVNAAQYGLDLERWMTAGTTAGDVRDDGVRQAAYDLASAEARCKHVGAVEAAELAVHVEPASHLAEVAARFGARSFVGDGNDANRTGHEADEDGTPVIVLAYVGSTASPQRQSDDDRC